ncbi:allophanate hydrolase [Noviherbaspirillum denitrificans]|uniref:Allophanate hydrolase n=1 Tax=Noviherbaspirillum denitrificans TaxID=1968433 RepID=A0A254TGD2_9BURK|nr:allophanate hydrolase [Noviherbaspirillum denitrificans]OWW21595.1 allophanate hydrolase [Noviherbaspirillum denitrificans]
MNNSEIPVHSASLDIPEVRRRYIEGHWAPSDCVALVLERIAQADRPEVWISRVDTDALQARSKQLDQLLRQEGAAIFRRMPLFGIPFAVKDNIDVAGMPTTAACPEFAYTPDRSATVVEKLEAAGAILVGKTNLDQFATGLNGTRSPYGAVRNAIDPAYVSGGSSSGSAVAVALGLVSFSLGTDTAGSGRVPAGLNGIVGLKPTRGLFSARGVFPACRTLDCVSIFAQTVADAWTVTRVMAGYDAEDSYSRKIPMLGVKPRNYRIAIPSAPEFFGDANARHAFDAVVQALRQSPRCTVGTIDYKPFQQAADLLYQGPWVAERLAAIGSFFNEKPEALHPVVGGIVGQGANYSAVDAFNGQYRLAALRREAEAQLAEYDFLLVPTSPTMPRIDEMLREPVKLNAQLGYYTNFVNFFDMAALSIPTPPRADGLPAGVTLIGPCGADQRLAAAAESMLQYLHKTPACAGHAAFEPLPFQEATVHIAVVGAHLEGQPLNWQLLERGAAKVCATRTAAAYRLYALPGTTPPKPGLVRTANDGAAIDIEIWELPRRYFGEFVAEVPSPLAIGTLELEDGRWVKGFVCELFALDGAQDISRFGGWRAYLASLNNP